MLLKRSGVSVRKYRHCRKIILSIMLDGLFQGVWRIAGAYTLGGSITINRILIFEDNRIKIVFNFEDAFMQAQELLRELEGKEGA